MVGQRTASACSISSVNEHLSSPRDSGESGRIKGHRAWISNPLSLSYKKPSENEAQPLLAMPLGLSLTASMFYTVKA